ncbi:hypothetical protein [Micromonospora sp. CPCC 206061]|uniref:hypothetical protein n=1 Tax=Micromonospora sp. CPCC 206061 TaxID=3122410 RepID=UPI002FF0B322
MRITHRRLAALAIAATLVTGGLATGGAAAASAAPGTTTQSALADDGDQEDGDRCPEWLWWDFCDHKGKHEYEHEYKDHHGWFRGGPWCDGETSGWDGAVGAAPSRGRLASPGSGLT